MRDTYTTKQAAELTGASRQAIRTYTTSYQRYFSTEGAPDQPGRARRFTRDDLRLIAYIYNSTGEQKRTHEQVQEALAAGELEQFTWQPTEAAESVEGSQEPASTALVPVERLVAAQALLQDAQRREAEAIDQVQALQDRLAALERELGQAEGKLAAQRKPPRWWTALFGGG